MQTFENLLLETAQQNCEIFLHNSRWVYVITVCSSIGVLLAENTSISRYSLNIENSISEP